MDFSRLLILLDALVSMLLVVVCVRRVRFLGDKDAAWKAAEARARERGLSLQRTPAWERRIDRQRLLLGLVSVVLGVTSIMLFLSSLQMMGG